MRDSLKDQAWFDQWIMYDIKHIDEVIERRKVPAVDKSYEPQHVYKLSNDFHRLILSRYSRGDAIEELAQYFEPLLNCWEEAERLGKGVWTPEQQHTRHAWKVNLDHYIRCFWLVGLALAFEIEDAQWQRLLVLIGNEGEDELLDRVIASRQPGRRIGIGLCHPKPYQRLLDAINAPSPKQAALLRVFVENWYKELDRLPKPGLSRDTAMYERPYWYEYHDIEGAYFGYWCIEAVAAVRAFSLDDNACLGLPNYPGDLLRPQGPSTHPQPTKRTQTDAMAVVARPDSLGDKLRRWMFAPKA